MMTDDEIAEAVRNLTDMTEKHELEWTATDDGSLKRTNYQVFSFG